MTHEPVRRTFAAGLIWFRRSLCALGLASILVFANRPSTSARPAPVSSKLVTVDHSLMYSPAKIQNWLDQKDSWGPAYTGGTAWKKFMELIHVEIKSMGMVNVVDYR